jgi:ACS family hexuronate transporter-like MFS transporter
MPVENPIAEAKMGGHMEDSAGPVHSRVRVGMLAGRFRWLICGLLFLGVTKNYMDRQVLGVLKGPLQHEFGWNEIDYGNLVFAFQTAYALGMILVGRLIDRLGTRVGYALAMVFWSLASMGHAIRTFPADICNRPLRLGIRRSWSFPGEHQVRCGMVSKERAGARDGDL